MSVISQRARILIVDDEEIDREIISTLLKSESYEILEASGGQQALEMLQCERVDLVLLDFVMKKIDGIEVCRRIKKDMRKLDLPVVFITSNSDRFSRLQARDAGCDDFVTKPIDPVELAMRVKNVLQVKAFHDQCARQKELLEVELDRTREKLLQIDRLATLGTLVAGIGHEMGNVLSTLTMTTDLMRARTEMNLPIREIDFSRLVYVANHLGTHTRYLLNYGRPDTQLRERLDLIEIVRAILDTLRVSGRLKGVHVDTELPSSPCMIQVNRIHIEQVLVNLVGNAVDALDHLDKHASRIRLALRNVDGERAEISIADNGCGIAPEKLNVIFDAFYTTKQPGKGTGLGLAVVKKIIESYSGRISVTSQLSQGTTMSFSLPIAHDLLHKHSPSQSSLVASLA